MAYISVYRLSQLSSREVIKVRPSRINSGKTTLQENGLIYEELLLSGKIVTTTLTV